MSFAYRHMVSPHGGPERTLIVMLPGLDMTAEDFMTYGLARAALERPGPFDLVVADIPADDYFEGGFADRLHESVVRPTQSDYRRTLVMGISLGAMGALFYARAYDVDGLVLVAPFLGTPGTIAAIARAGGLAAWEPGRVGPRELERGLLAWLKGFCASAERPWLLLGYGTDDRFVAGAELLAPAVRSDRVVKQRGGHDWQTWAALWAQLLDHACMRGRESQA